jgi:hypothetical protein
MIVMLQDVVDAFVAEYMPVENKGQKKPKNQQETKGYSSWFYWRRTSEPKKISANLSPSDVSSPESEKLSNVKEVHMWLIMIHWKVRSHLEKNSLLKTNAIFIQLSKSHGRPRGGKRCSLPCRY